MFLNICHSFVIIRKIVCHHNKHNIHVVMLSFVRWYYTFECWRFCHCEQFSFKAHISISTCLIFLIFAIYVGNTSFKSSVIFILHNFIIVWLYLSWKNVICAQFWTGAVVRYYGNWKWCCFYIVCYKPIKVGHLVGNKLYYTIILTFIPIGGKSKSYKHSLIIYWTALVYISLNNTILHFFICAV